MNHLSGAVMFRRWGLVVAVMLCLCTGMFADVVNDLEFQPQVPLGPGEFMTAAQFATGVRPKAMALADFNHDGNIDIAVANSSSNNVSILLGKQNGTFTAGTAVVAGTSPAFVAAGTFNGDGNVDLVTVDSGGSHVNLALGNGNGTFQTAVSIATNSSNCNSVLAADLNRDGKLDLAVGCSSGSLGVAILLGNGNGTFQTPIVSSVVTSLPMAVDDVNNDQKPDLLIPTGSAKFVVQVLLGNGDGTFQTPKSTPTMQTPLAVTTGDFNQDGKIDLAVANGQDSGAGLSQASILLGDGMGGFSAPQSVSLTANVVSAIAAGDFNGDSKLDVAVAESGTNNLSILLGNGNGTLQSPVDYGVGTTPVGVAVQDFTRDGIQDLAVLNTTGDFPSSLGSVSVLIGSGNGKFQAGTSSVVGVSGRCSPGCLTPHTISVDLNKDKKLDVVAVNNGNASVSVLLGNGNGTFQTHVDYPLTGTSPQAVVVGDFNNDSKLDLAVANLCGSFCAATQGSVDLLLGNGDGTFQPAEEITTGEEPIWLATGDFNKDGKPDLIYTAHGNNTVNVMLGDGHGGFGSPITSSALTSGVTQIVVGDFNNDTKADAVIVVPGSLLLVLLGNGDGTFESPKNVVLAHAAGMAAGDLNKDGKLDLVASGGPANTSVTVLLGKGDGTFQTGVAYTVDNTPKAVALTDLNGDGKLDAIFAAYPAASVLIGNGDGTFRPYTSYALGGQSLSLTVADFNGDAASDIAASFGSTGTATNSIQMLLNTGGTIITLTSSAKNTTYGENVTFTATVKASVKVFGQPSPTGVITFKDGASVLKSVPLNGGQVSFSTSTLGAGTHLITAVYSGDAHYNPHASIVVKQVVAKAASTTTMVSSLNPSTVGQNVTFTATVASSTTGVPTGTVTFKDGSTALGTGSLNSGQAAFSTTGLSKGSHAITAVYAGDSNFEGSVSPVLTQVVN